MFDEFNNNQEEGLVKSKVSGFWSEKVFVVTEDYEIKGYVFMPKTGRKNRVLSDILNGQKRFVAIKDAEIKNKRYPDRQVELHDFIQINLDSIILIRTSKDN